MGYIPISSIGEQVGGEASGVDKEMPMYRLASLMKEPLESSVSVTVDSVEREKRMKVLHEAIKVVIGFLQEYKLKGFFVKTSELVEWKSLHLVA